ncbi:precorrin-6A synthase (deacetylating) [Mycobacterium sp. M1]|uniref:Precorrin-6A synthase (Deacetylating) n=1 Tax=Mycolicibacter acidiphilus TaxID=2835306 RepID=A0ABS5RHZ8_9MYCO|nr:precorrin-6A synthase (deacetylating) [Mycolicibacter acidiphilus]MBS9533920.1 precorrin-6A synthase (deacetylating) [Mycolicibacter acidiphilus]
MRVRILGIGMGPRQVTPEVAEALAGCDYVLAADHGADSGRLTLRRAVVDAYAPTVPIIAIPDPERDRSPGLTAAGYATAVADWHAERAARYAAVLRERGGTAAFLVWGDPALYDSTIRIVEQVKALGVHLDFDVLPGISAPQLLAARHRIVLHEVGAPVHITTGRRLAETVAAGQRNIVAMLNPAEVDLSGLDDWTIWWGANLGAAGERLVTGRVADVAGEIGAARAAARAEAGWVMDVFLVRRS